MTDQMPDPEEEARKAAEQFEELFRSKVDGVEAAARRCGLHVHDLGLTLGPRIDHDPITGEHTMDGMQPVMVGNFAVGDAAWSDRIQNPQQDSTEAEFRKMAVEAEKEKFEETRAELERRLREGKDLLGGEEDA